MGYNGMDLRQKIIVGRFSMSEQDEQRVVQVSQFDTMTRVVMDLYNADGEPYNLPEDECIEPYMAIVRANDELDDEVTYTPGENRVEYTLNRVSTSMVGSFGCQLMIPGIDGNIAAGPRWRLVVKPAVYRGAFQRAQSSPQAGDTSYNIFANALVELNNALTEIRTLDNAGKLLTATGLYRALTGEEPPEGGVTLAEALAGFVTEEELWRAVNGMATSRQVEEAVALLQPKLIPGGTIMSYSKAERRLALMISGALIASATLTGCWKDGERANMATYLRNAVFVATEEEAAEVEAAINSLAGENGTLDAAEPVDVTVMLPSEGIVWRRNGQVVQGMVVLSVPVGGTTVTLTAEAADGYTVTGISGTGVTASWNSVTGVWTVTVHATQSSGSITVSADTEVLVQDTNTVRVNEAAVTFTNGLWSGTGYNIRRTFNMSSGTITYSVEAQEGYRVTANVTVNGVPGGSTVTCGMTDEAAIAFTVTAVRYYNVLLTTVNCSRTDGAVSGQTINEGTIFNVEISAYETYNIDELCTVLVSGLADGYTVERSDNDKTVTISGTVVGNVYVRVQAENVNAPCALITDIGYGTASVKVGVGVGEAEEVAYGEQQKIVQRGEQLTVYLAPDDGDTAGNISYIAEPENEWMENTVGNYKVLTWVVHGTGTLTVRRQSGAASAELVDGILTISNIDEAAVEDGVLTIEIE